MPIAEIKHFHLFCGLGGGAKGFNEGEARVGNLHARFRCIGGVYCSEFDIGAECPYLAYEDECDTLCTMYEKVPHPVWVKERKEFRLRRCPACFDGWVKDKLARLRGLLEDDHV